MIDGPLLFTAKDLLDTSFVTVQEVIGNIRGSATGSKNPLTLGRTQLMSPEPAKDFLALCIEKGGYEVDLVIGNPDSIFTNCSVRICTSFTEPNHHLETTSYYIFSGTSPVLKDILIYVIERQLWQN